MRVLVLADDLIWSTRLMEQVKATGEDAAPVRTLAALSQALAAADAVIVDLTARAYDGVIAVRRAADAGRRVLAVGQHDDAELRRRALAAGAERVLAYGKLFEDGPATLERWLHPVPPGGPR
jgi:DNA-binding NarL/FixJ family response regulator